MPNINFIEYALSIQFLIGAGLTVGTFLPLLYSVWITWQENDYKEENLKQQVREQLRAKQARRRIRMEERRALGEGTRTS